MAARRFCLPARHHGVLQGRKRFSTTHGSSGHAEVWCLDRPWARNYAGLSRSEESSWRKSGTILERHRWNIGIRIIHCLRRWQRPDDGPTPRSTRERISRSDMGGAEIAGDRPAASVRVFSRLLTPSASSSGKRCRKWSCTGQRSCLRHRGFGTMRPADPGGGQAERATFKAPASKAHCIVFNSGIHHGAGGVLTSSSTSRRRS